MEFISWILRPTKSVRLFDGGALFGTYTRLLYSSADPIGIDSGTLRLHHLPRPYVDSQLDKQMHYQTGADIKSDGIRYHFQRRRQLTTFVFGPVEDHLTIPGVEIRHARGTL